MKKIFTCLLLFVFAIIGRGQDYLPMLNSDICWERKYVDNISIPPVMEQRGFYYTLLNNVEVINGNQYMGLFNEYDPVEQNDPIGYIREDIGAQKIFYLNVSEEFEWLNCGGEEILLYDFSAELGDTVYHCPNSDLYYVIQSVEIVEEYTNSEIDFSGFGGGRVFEVFSSEFNFSIIYEGVGSNIGPIHEPPNISVPGNEILAAHSYDCAFILSTNESIRVSSEIFPNPVKNNLNVKLGEGAKLSGIKIYDVSCQIQVTDKISGTDFSVDIEKLANGLYFIMGYDEAGRQIFNQRFVKMN